MSQFKKKLEIEDMDAMQLLETYNTIMSSESSGIVRRKVWNEIIQRLKFYDRNKKPTIITLDQVVH